MGDHKRGVLAAGMETGEINVYDPAKILAGSRFVQTAFVICDALTCVYSADEARIFKSDKHTGPVRGLDFNPIQKNLLLSGAINAEVGVLKPASRHPADLDVLILL
jgi:protein transport protein SEC31